MPRYAERPFPYRTPPELAGGGATHRPVIIVGAGPVGLAAAVDLALHGVASVVLDEGDAVSVGSRAICWSKRTLEIFDRLGVGERMVRKGVTWRVGRLFHRQREVYSFDLLPEAGHKMPAFINLQQYYVEQFLIERCADFPELIDLRWKNRVTTVAEEGGVVRAAVATPDGDYRLCADYILACDGAHSTIRALLGLPFEGARFEERFLIADVEMTAAFPPERWFWFEPPFHAGQSALLHKQPDNIYRIDLQLGPEADPQEERRPEKVIPRIAAVVGGRPFELDWVSVYSFRCLRLERFVHGRIIFAGDAAHVVSPFGARGGNSGIQDVDNLCWKLAAVIAGRAPAALLETYHGERAAAADENILHAARATNFMTPKTAAERLFRDGVLALAGEMDFARALINSGRLSTPCVYDTAGADSPLLPARTRPGAAACDAPLGEGWLLDRLGGGFGLLLIGLDETGTARPCGWPLRPVAVPAAGLLRERYLGGAETAAYLIRPDQHIAARWERFDPQAVSDALRAAAGYSEG
jgi:3-(3-hydroxy-phenyl)propionate hydroxylase